MKALWNGAVVAESADVIVVEGNHYFPCESLDRDHRAQSRLITPCWWKGIAHYYTLVAGGKELRNAAWYYPRPWPLARGVRGRVAFAYPVEIANG